MNLNRFQLIGRVGKNEPEMKYTPAGKAVTKFSMAVNSGFGDKQTTDWFDIVCFGTTAENVKKYVEPGQELYVEGRIQKRKYEKDGQTRYAVDFIGNVVQFGAKKSGGNSQEPVDLTDSDETIPEDDFPF